MNKHKPGDVIEVSDMNEMKAFGTLYNVTIVEDKSVTSLPTNAAARKNIPLAEGLLWYFPNALAAVATVSKVGNDQHNPGQPMHWSRGKSSDHADCAARHLLEAGTVDEDGQRHTAKAAWRILALLQEELERDEGYPLPRNARYDKEGNDGQLSTNPVPAGSGKEQVLPLAGRPRASGDVAGNSGPLRGACRCSESYLGPVC